ncbi:MAG: Hsp20/alpha crystallin family protein [Firmicutes bacterium]|nr:Hsp20/alpha crystallin family protein [Bacillota bacterium]
MFDLIPFRNRRHGKVSELEDSFNSLFSNFFNDFMDISGFSFKADIKEEEDKYCIEAELPGLNKEEINVELNDGRLLISASRNEVVEKDEDNYIYRERSTGKFQRSFQLENVKEDEISAEYKNGILKIELPKEEPGMKRRRVIDIN